MSYLRDYQQQCKDSVFSELTNGTRSTLAVLPTGTGKTEIALELADTWPDGEILFLSHRQELVFQPSERWEKKTSQHAEIIMGEFNASTTKGRSKFISGSVQTLCRPDRLKYAFPDPNRVGLVICFPAGTLVTLANGSTVSIETVVDKNQTIDVASVNLTTGQIEAQPITGHSRHLAHQLTTIHLQDGTQLNCTPNHPILTQSGYVRADCLTPNDSVLKYSHESRTRATGVWQSVGRRAHGDRRSLHSPTIQSESQRNATRLGNGEVRRCEAMGWDSTFSCGERRLGRSTDSVHDFESPRIRASLRRMLPKRKENDFVAMALSHSRIRLGVVVHGRRFKAKSRDSDFYGRIQQEGKQDHLYLDEESVGGLGSGCALKEKSFLSSFQQGTRPQVQRDNTPIRDSRNGVQAVPGKVARLPELWQAIYATGLAWESCVLFGQCVSKDCMEGAIASVVLEKQKEHFGRSAGKAFGQTDAEGLLHLREDVPYKSIKQISLRERGLQEEATQNYGAQMVFEKPPLGSYAMRVVSSQTLLVDVAVYDVTVANNHNFFADGVLVHNCDEAHHAAKSNKSYSRIFDYLLGGNPDCRLFGITATPDRSDEMALGATFESCAFEYPLFDPHGGASAIGDGWLVPIRQEYITVEDLNFDLVASRGGDFIDSSLEKQMLQEKVLHKITAPLADLAIDRKVLGFSAGIEQAIKCAEIMNRSRDGSAMAMASRIPEEMDFGFVVNSGDLDQRRRHLRRYKAGEFQYLFNMGIFLEGYDEPGIGLVSCGRPTKSRALHAQMIGRGTRILPGVIEGTDYRVNTADDRKSRIALSAKPNLIVLDFVGNSWHPLVSAIDVLGGNYTDEVVERAKRNSKKAGGDIQKALEEAEQQIRKELEERRRIQARATYTRTPIDPFGVIDVVPVRKPGYYATKPISDKQREVLIKFRLEPKEFEKLDRWGASQLIGGLFDRRKKNLCSFKQAKLLAKFGERTDVPFEVASQRIERIKQNGWKPLSDAGMEREPGSDG